MNANIQSLLMSEVNRKMNIIYEKKEKMVMDAIENCTPPIKGKITKGKIKWRGLKIYYQNMGSYCLMWVQQRDKIITDKIVC